LVSRTWYKTKPASLAGFFVPKRVEKNNCQNLAKAKCRFYFHCGLPLKIPKFTAASALYTNYAHRHSTLPTLLKQIKPTKKNSLQHLPPVFRIF
jgi:hypothetical protein